MPHAPQFAGSKRPSTHWSPHWSNGGEQPGESPPEPVIPDEDEAMEVDSAVEAAVDVATDIPPTPEPLEPASVGVEVWAAQPTAPTSTSTVAKRGT